MLDAAVVLRLQLPRSFGECVAGLGQCDERARQIVGPSDPTEAEQLQEQPQQIRTQVEVGFQSEPQQNTFKLAFITNPNQLRKFKTT